MTTPDPLKPCPFCGSAAEIVSIRSEAPGYPYAMRARCVECHQAVLGVSPKAAREGAIEAWNTRAEAQQQPQGQWIACAGAMPEPCVRVLADCGRYGAHTGFYSPEDRCWYVGLHDEPLAPSRVFHWLAPRPVAPAPATKGSET